MGIAIALILAVVVVVAGRNNSASSNEPVYTNVSATGDSQIIEISAKGGYSPRVTAAKAGMPTILRLNTRGTFDCSSALTIPSLGYRVNLPPSGSTEVKLPAQQAGTVLHGVCAMGMYNFAVNFN